MPDATTFGVVVAATLVLSLTPGPAVLYIVARGVEGGRPAGLVSALGICARGLVHVAFAAAGLSALLASSATAFAVVKWLGVVYLVWLGLSRLLGDDERNTATRVEGNSLRAVFWQGVLVDVLNPKVALFFLAFLPQFVEPSRGPVWTQMVLLGLTFAVVALCTDGLYALLSGTVADWLRRRNESPGFRRAGRHVSGSVYLALSAATAVSGSGKD
jgi:threonine/homoserine/homoserine lactone efflux protein